MFIIRYNDNKNILMYFGISTNFNYKITYFTYKIVNQNCNTKFCKGYISISTTKYKFKIIWL